MNLYDTLTTGHSATVRVIHSKAVITVTWFARHGLTWLRIEENGRVVKPGVQMNRAELREWCGGVVAIG